jgi:pimeloyl-ACP methyl ester carboxylesterase
MPSLISERYSIPPSSDYPLHVVAKRYRLDQDQPNSDDGFTLIFMHATGSFKEIWEVTIQRLLERQKEVRGTRVSDIFSIENPNHGESAVLNEDALKKHYPTDWHPREYTKAAHRFLTAGTQAGARIDFSKRRIIGVGHSVGAPALFLMRELQPPVKFSSFIGIEPGISQKDNPDTNASTTALIAWTWLRKDTWPSRKSARKDLERQPLYAMWDPRILDLYVAHGLRTHSGAKFKPPFGFRGVATALTREHEAASFRSDELVVDGLEAYTILTQQMPIHVIWGTYNDIATPALQDLLSDRSAGRTPASVRSLEDCGHLAVQQKPEAVADAIYDIIYADPLTKSKL